LFRDEKKSAARRADLHVHTSHSDGVYSPAEIAARAAGLDLKAVSITDHDTIDGIAGGRESCSSLGLDFVAGIELTTVYAGHEVHLLGYLFDERSPSLNRTLDFLKQERVNRTRLMLEKLESLGIGLEAESLLENPANGAIGRPHIASLLVKKGVVPDFNQAFKKFLVPGAPAYVPHYPLALEKACELIRENGGLPILAHPGVLDRDELIPGIVKSGVVGIEVVHPFHDRDTTRRYLAVSERFNLIPTGGSDYHGPGRGPDSIGSYTVPGEVVDLMRETAIETAAF